MKARIKATGEVIEVERVGVCSNIWALKEDATVIFENDELDVNTEPDYWEKLTHQYAGMVMQGLLTNLGNTISPDYIVEEAEAYATALVEKLKEEK